MFYFFYDSFYDHFRFILKADSLDGSIMPAWHCEYRHSANAIVTPFNEKSVKTPNFVQAETHRMKFTCQLCLIQRNQIIHYSNVDVISPN